MNISVQFYGFHLLCATPHSVLWPCIRILQHYSEISLWFGHYLLSLHTLPLKLTLSRKYETIDISGGTNCSLYVGLSSFMRGVPGWLVNCPRSFILRRTRCFVRLVMVVQTPPSLLPLGSLSKLPCDYSSEPKEKTNGTTIFTLLWNIRESLNVTF